MKGILVVSHGTFAKGIVDTARYIVGENLSQLSYCCYEKEDDPESFHKKIVSAFDEVDKGDGVIILLDLATGRCLKEAAFLLNEKVEIMAGVNVPLLLEVLTGRMSGDVPGTGSLIEKGQRGLIDVRKYLADTLN